MRRWLFVQVLYPFLLVLGAAGVPALAQSGSQPPSSPSLPDDLPAIFSDTLDVQASQVDVVVTDKEGDRIPGLTVADFQLLVDGKETPIESFAEIRDRQVVPSSVSVDPTSTKFQGEAEAGNNYLIFIDEIFSDVRLRDEALRGISADLRVLDPRDQVAIVAASRNRIKILSTWTHGGPALDQLMTRMIRHNGLLASSDLHLEQPGTLPSRIEQAYQNHLDRFFAEEARTFGVSSDAHRELNPIEKATTAAAASLRAFSGLPGRKIMMLLSGGWMLTWKPEESPTMHWLADTANQLGFTVYPVHLVWTIEAGRMQLTAHLQRKALKFTAEETGGLLLKPGRNRHVGKAERDTSSAYRLGFTFSGDDRRRDIKVKMKRPDLEARAPKNFLPLSRQALVRQQVDSALLHGALTGMEPLSVSVGELQPTKKGQADLPVTVQIPIDQIAMIVYSGRRVGQLELRMSALADDGSRTVITAVPIWVLHDEAARPIKTKPYQATIQVEDKPQTVQLMLVDVLSGKSYGEQVRVEPRSN